MTIKDEKKKAARKARRQVKREEALKLAAEPMADVEAEAMTDKEAQEVLEKGAEEKCYDQIVVIEEPYVPFGGAQSWRDLEKYLDSEATTDAVRETEWEFRSMVDNVLEDKSISITEKSARIAALADGFENRVAVNTEAFKEEDEPKGFIEKIVDKLKPKKKEQEEIKSSGFVVEKDLKGQHRWFGWVSNKYRDRDGEIISEAAHKEFIEWVYKDAAARMPQLWLWHTPKTAMKERADWIDYADGFLHASGPLTEKEAKMLEGIDDPGMSHGFFCNKENDIINKYRSFEGSVLPLKYVANEWTDFATLQQEAKDMFNPQKREFLVGRLGEEKVAELEASTKDRVEILKELGIEFKEAEEIPVVEKEEEPTPEEPVVEKEATALDAKAILDALGLSELSEYLEGQSKQVEELTATVKEQSETITALQKSDDEKIAETLTPRVDVEKDLQPVWLRRLSQSEETKAGEEDPLLKEKPGTESSWISDAMGQYAPDPSAEVPMS